ncbi:hypothetical protein [Promicromonospora sp. NPDC050262]|uniref:hypothetical protein n=1 Tax=Promicromonospora sp. NPDC050262 TaxID=3155036 RepID=UPI0033F9EC84
MRLRGAALRAAAVLAGGALVASSVLVPAVPANASAADLPALSGVTVGGQACGADPVTVVRDRQGSDELPFTAELDVEPYAGVSRVMVVARDALDDVVATRTYETYDRVVEESIRADDLTDNAVNTLRVSVLAEDGTSGPAAECTFLLRRGPLAELSVVPVLGAETVYTSWSSRGGVGVAGAFAIVAPQSPDTVAFAYGYAAEDTAEPAVWTTVPATEHAVIPFVPTTTGQQVVKVAEVDETGLIGVATSLKVYVARPERAETVPPAVIARKLTDTQPDDDLVTVRLTLTDDLVAVAGQATLYDGATQLGRTTFDARVKDVVLRQSQIGPGHRDLRVEYEQFAGAPTVTTTLRVCVASCPFTGGSATVRSTWSSTTGDPSYNSSYEAVAQGFSPTPASYTYQWLRNGAAIKDATSKQYLSSPADIGHSISVRITAQGPTMSPRSVTSTPFTVKPRDGMHVNYDLSPVGSSLSSSYCYCTASDGQSTGRAGSGRAAQALVAFPSSQSYTTGLVPPTSAESEMPAAFWFETEGYVQGRGWVGPKAKNGIYYVGSIGEQRRLEAFRITPGGPHAPFYDVWYRVYVPKYGWLGWAKNGEAAGTTGFGYGVEDVQIRVLPKGKAPATSGTGNAPFYDKATQNQVTVQPYLRPAGWKTTVHGGSTAGLTSTSQRLNAVRVDVDGQRYSGGVQVSAKVEGDGWRSWVGDTKVAGTYHRTDRTSAYKMRLTGEMAKQYDIYYRVHVAGTGWLGWAKNGAGAGTESYKYRNTAVQVVLVKKGERPLMSAYGRAAYKR